VTDDADGSWELATAVEDVLVNLGPMEVEALADELAGLGYDLGADPADRLLEEVLEAGDSVYMPLPDDRWCHLPSLLYGRIFTHRVTAVELAHDVLGVAPDLDPILMLSDEPEYTRFVDGTAVRIVMPDFPSDEDRDVPSDALDMSGSLLLRPGTLAGLGVAAGDLVGLQLTATGLELVRAEQAVPAETIADLSRRVLAMLQADPEHPLHIEDVAYGLLADVPTAFVEPLLPLQELLAGWQLPTFGDLVGVPGFDFAEWRAHQRIARLSRRYELSEDEALAVAAISRLHESVLGVMDAFTTRQDSGDTTALESVLGATPPAAQEQPDPAAVIPARTVAATLPFLEEPAVAQALLEETCFSDESSAASLGLLAETLEPQADRSARPALRWLRARAYEELGDPDAAEQALRQAEQLDPSWPPTVIDLARYANDRGDVATGLVLLRRIDDDAAPTLRAVLEHHRPSPARSMPRNDPCWCGSGRKFKHCHLRQSEQLPLSERAGWLYQKAGLYVFATSWRHLVDDLDALRVMHLETDQQADELINDGHVLDVTLFEGGALDDFISHRGAVLPADELLLVEQWLLTERSVFEVTAVAPGASLTVRDVRTGDVITVPERTASRELRPGQLICTHVLPTGDNHQLFGGIEPVKLHEREALIRLLDSEPEPEEVVEFCSRRFAPPTLANTEGHPIVLCKAELRSDNPAELRDGLDGRYRRQEPSPSASTAMEWLETVEVDGMNRISANLRLAGDTLTVTTNSEERQDAALAAVRSLQPSIVLVSQQRTPLRTARYAARLAETVPPSRAIGPSELEGMPEIKEAVAEHMRRYEEQWLDLSIPALEGLTPRQAADDPTRRENVLQLLATFPETDDPLKMSPSRLRDALGLGTS
jgi:hypothetical protein